MKIPFEKISLFNAWKEIESKNPTFSPVTIGIVDTGVDAKHPEFAGEVIGGTLRGAVDFGSSSFFAKRDGDNEGHGTQVAGIIGASNISPFTALPAGSPQTNGIIAGVTENYILEARRPVINTFFNIQLNTIKAALSEANVVNIGFTAVKQSALRFDQKGKIGGEVSDSIFQISVASWGLVFNQFQNTLFIIPAGNSDTDVQSETPSNFSSTFSNVIAVGALDGLSSTDDRDITPPEGSNFGDAVVIAAPGSSIYTPKKFSSPLGFDDYDTNFLGTSASAPMVTGVAGLIKAIKLELTPVQIKQILTESADPITASTTEEIDKKLGSACNDGRPGFRGCRLNALAAVCHRDVLNCVPPPPLPSEEGFIVFIFPKIGIPTKLIRVTADGIQTDIFDFGKRISGDGVVIDSNGDFIVLATSELLRITAGGVATRIFNGNNIPIGTRCGLATDSNGNFIVMVDSVLSRITPEGMQTEIFEFPSGVEPRGITVASNGDFIVTELGINTLSRVTRQGVRIPLFIFDPQQLGFGVAIDP